MSDHTATDDTIERSCSSQRESVRTFVNYMKSLLSAEDLEKYEKVGNYMYQGHDDVSGAFQTTPSSSSVTSIRLEESLAYVVEGLKSGLHPNHLSYDEVHLLRAGYGNEWYTLWGYTVDDVPTEYR